MSIQDALNKIRLVAQALPDDDPDKLEMLNIEGDYTALMEWAAGKYNEYEAMQEAVTALAKSYSDRAKSFAGKSEGIKNLIYGIMTAASEKKFVGIAATISVRDNKPHPVIQDESLVPDEYFKTERILQKSRINDAVKAGEEIPGVVMSNGSQSITIRRN